MQSVRVAVGAALLGALVSLQAYGQDLRGQYEREFIERITPAFSQSQASVSLQGVYGRLQDMLTKQKVNRFEPHIALPMIDQLRFAVVEFVPPGKKKTALLAAVPEDGEKQLPSLADQTDMYMHDVHYASLTKLVEDEYAKSRQDGSTFSVEAMQRLDPFQNGSAMSLPDFGPFKDRKLFYTGLLSKLTDEELAGFEKQKEAMAQTRAPRNTIRGTQATRPFPYGFEVQTATLHQGSIEAQYRIFRGVERVEDVHLADGSVLLRIPRVGSTVKVDVCTKDCYGQDEFGHRTFDEKNWDELYPDKAPERAAPDRRMPGFMDASRGPTDINAPAGDPFPF